jgi:hypothetical protein
VDHRQLVRTLNAARVVVGASLVLLPGPSAERWIGSAAHDPAVKVMVRALGARDLAIGAGTMAALANGDPVRHWTLAGAASDLTDAAATLLAFRSIGARRAIPLLVAATIAGLAGISAADHLD